MTRSMLLTLGLAIAGQVLYHIGQRAVPRDVHPLVILSVAYFAAGTLCVGVAWFMGELAGGDRLRAALGWPIWLITISIVAIELGFLLAYRSGWTVGAAFAVAAATTICVLATFGKVVLHNPLNGRQLAGLALSIVAVWLLSTESHAT